jgi:hypothetical protein
MGKESELPVSNGGAAASGRVTRRQMVRRLLAGAGAGATWPLVAAAHPFYGHLENDTVLDSSEKLGARDWTPVFLNGQQNETLVALSERIVPGAMKAQVNRFIDLLLSVDTPEHKKSFLDSLAAFEAESQKQFGKGFPSLQAELQNGLLREAAARPAKEDSLGSPGKETPGLREHFENLKGWISGAYYSSEAGMRELGWTGDYVHEGFPGCGHAEGHNEEISLRGIS